MRTLSLKSAEHLRGFSNSILQKITATDDGQLILSIYSVSEKKRTMILSMKKGESGLSAAAFKPVPQPKPNSFVQIARKYIQGKKVTAAYATLSPLSIIIEFQEYCLILDLSHKPPRLVFSQKFPSVPERYQPQYGPTFQDGGDFFESLCEWSEENTKTKRRACFEAPSIAFCPLPEPTPAISSDLTVEKTKLSGAENNILSSPIMILPQNIRKSVRTRMQFLERRVMRQKGDFPSEAEELSLQKQSEALQNLQEQWPANSNKIYHEIYVQKRRKEELTKRIAESEQALQNFKILVDASVKEFSEKDISVPLHDLPNLVRLCQVLDIPVVAGKLAQKNAQKHEKKKETTYPYRSFVASTGEFIRVARSATDGDVMLKSMPSHHIWLHVLTGEGSHVWLEKPKGASAALQAQREASILAIHYSKHRRAQQAEVQIATRADIEKKKNLPPGKVIVRRCRTTVVKYTEEDLQKLFTGEKK